MQKSSCCSDHENSPIKDIVCGMEIEPTENTPQVAHKGKIYYFCNEECKNKFIANPQKYVG